MKVIKNTVRQSFFDRVMCMNKVPLSPDFIKFIKNLALLNNQYSQNDIWDMWQEYTDKCTAMDQSPSKHEFVSWYKLETTIDTFMGI